MRPFALRKRCHTPCQPRRRAKPLTRQVIPLLTYTQRQGRPVLVAGRQRSRIHLPGSPVEHASEEAEHAQLRAKRDETLGPKADPFVARALARAAVIVTARKTPES
jgi:hypothetical protein